MKKIGIMGGSFNPIHLGHLHLADTARLVCKLDKVIFMPTMDHPFKDGKAFAPIKDRMEMIRLAIEDNPHFELSDLEVHRQGTCYTIDTLRELQTLYPESEFYFITGADIIMELPRWHEPEILLKEMTMITASRPGLDDQNLDTMITALEKDYGAKILKIPAAKLEISSSQIRKNIHDGLSVQYLMPEKAAAYLFAHRLYCEDRDDGLTEAQIKNKLQQFLKPSRYQHTLGVVECSVSLLKRFSSGFSQDDLQKVKLAALLHDCAKNFSSDMLLKIAEENGILLDSVSRKNRELLHGPIGAVVAKEEFGIEEPEILNAIRYHTTGRENMSFLEKIIFLADYIEPNRQFPGVEKLRKLARENLDEAILAALTNTIIFVTQKGELLHLDTVLTRNALLAKKHPS